MSYRQDQPTAPHRAVPPPNPVSLPPPPQPAPTPHSTYMRRDRRGRLRPVRRPPRARRSFLQVGCLTLVVLLVCVVLTVAAYLVVPGRTNLLLLGIDYAEPGSYASRTDTIILASFAPKKPAVSLLSVPRDLWVKIPGVGENRINTAHFYAESRQAGAGPQAVEQTIAANFGVNMDYYLRIRFEGFRDLIDAFGGVDIVLSEPTAGYPAGRVHLNGRKALAFVRDRANTDDFFRMSHGQLMLKALFLNALNPLKWPRFPLVANAFIKNVDTDIPLWMWPRLGLMLLLSGPNGIDFQVLPREMATPYVTDQGANVLLPNWDLIHLLVKQMFAS